jgi:hypothetical protein
MFENLSFGFYPQAFVNQWRKEQLSTLFASFVDNTYENIIETCRNFYDENMIEAYSLSKKKLPAVTFSGTFSPSRKSQNIESYTGLIVLDIDNLKKEELPQIKTALSSDKYVIAVWTSPSGAGLKFLIHSSVGQEMHKNVFRTAAHYYQATYNIVVDVSGSDVSRLCFVSHDKHMKFGANAIDFAEALWEKVVINEGKSVTPYLPQKKVRGIVSNSNIQKDKKTLKKIYHFLNKRNLSITDSYENWIKVAFAISSSFSYDVARKHFLEFCRLDHEKHDELLSEKLIASCYKEGVVKSSFSTIVFLAKQKGYDPNFNIEKRKGLSGLVDNSKK